MSSRYLHQAFAAVGERELERAAGCCTQARDAVATRPARRELPLRRLPVVKPDERRRPTCC